MSHLLKQYITDARGGGMTNAQIIEELTKVGWLVHDFADLFIERQQTESTDSIISVRDVSKSYGAVQALARVSLEVKRGSVTALLGPNGAGKSTLIKILTTLLTPSSGSATVAGFDTVREPQKLRAVIGLAGQSAAVDEILTGMENLVMVGQLYHLSKHAAQSRALELLKKFNLEEAANRTLKTYSGGMRRRLDLAASIVVKPTVLFLDEPTTGLDPQSRFGMWNVIRDLVADGTTVLLTTQYMEEADQLANHIFVIDHGRIIEQGTPDELKRKVGGDVVEIHMADHRDASRASEAIGIFGVPHFDAETGIITMPSTTGAAMLVDVVRKLDSERLKILDVILRRPSLDDVFIKLTGHNAL